MTASYLRAFAAEAMTLRALIDAAIENASAEHAGGGMRAAISSVPLGELSGRYEKLMMEWCHEIPNTDIEAVAFLDLAKEIIVTSIGDKEQPSCQDLFYAATLLSGVKLTIDQRGLKSL